MMTVESIELMWAPLTCERLLSKTQPASQLAHLGSSVAGPEPLCETC